MFKKFDFDINENGCFICNTHKPENQGYFRVNVNGKQIKLHRFIYEVLFGYTPDNQVVRHTCNNPSCINPEHLILGTQKQNMHDRVLAGTLANGENHGASILTEIDVIEIRKSTLSERVLGRRYNVSNITIHDIKSYKTWKHIS